MLVSIIVLAHNELDYTRQCLQSIRRHTPEPYELIVVDNGSKDHTYEYLRTLPGTKIISNDKNLGFAAGNNQALAVAQGEYVVLLNNDTLVTDDWLPGLLRPMQQDADIGYVGPRSNWAPGLQLLEPIPYTNDEGLTKFAAERRSGYAGQGKFTALLNGFCIAVQRQIIDTIGGFDVRFGLGNYEDMDFCLRATLAGFKGWIADDVFIHHYGHRTFMGAGIDYLALLHTNAQKFATKWNLPFNVITSKITYPDNLLKIPFYDIVSLPSDVSYVQVT